MQMRANEKGAPTVVSAPCERRTKRGEGLDTPAALNLLELDGAVTEAVGLVN